MFRKMGQLDISIADVGLHTNPTCDKSKLCGYTKNNGWKTVLWQSQGAISVAPIAPGYGKTDIARLQAGGCVDGRLISTARRNWRCADSALQTANWNGLKTPYVLLPPAY